jgi:hypothetical protein
VHVSDDLRTLKQLPEVVVGPDFNGAFKRSPSATVIEAAHAVASQMRSDGSKLGGVYINANGGFAAKAPAVHRGHAVIGDLMVVDPTCGLRFDEAMTTKEDYDYTAQHLDALGRVTRCNRFVPNFVHRTNAGGAVDHRKEDRAAEKRNIAILQRKWPGVFKVKKANTDEVTMRWAGRAAAATPSGGDGEEPAAKRRKHTSRISCFSTSARRRPDAVAGDVQ